MAFLGDDNKTNDVLMGCYGIGVSRLMGVIAEYFCDEKGIAWPEHLAPATYYVIVLGDENIETAKGFALKLESEGKEVILDDRPTKKFGYGQKMGDAEVLGIPHIVIISGKTLEQGGYEVRKRGESEGQIMKF